MNTRNGRMIGICLLGALTAGCGDIEDSSVVAPEAAALSSAHEGRGARACGAALDPKKNRDHRFHKRCERYQQKRAHRGGKGTNAQLTTRVLMDAQRMTLVEATTSDFEDVAPPGRIERLNVEVARACPRCRNSRSIVATGNSGSGYANTTVANLLHGQNLSITASVSGIGRGMDRVSVDDQVRYRPDLVVGAIDVPAAPAVGVPISIAATIRETAGDEGANTDCVLSVDGVEADRANGVWIDAHGLVTCHFTHTFTSVGAHHLAVALMNVAPRDYDPTNNRGEVTVTAAAQFSFSGGVSHSTYAGQDVEDVLDPSGALAYHRDDTWSGLNQSLSVSGTWPKAVTFPLASLKATVSSAGQTWSLVDLSGLVVDASDGLGMACASGSDPTGYNWVGICTTDSEAPSTQLSVSAFAGDVTYHSAGVCQTTSSLYDCAGGYTWNSGSDPQGTTFHSIAGNVTFNLAVTDATGVSLVASPMVPVASFTTSDSMPRACTLQPDDSQQCTSHTYTENGVAGTAQQ